MYENLIKQLRYCANSDPVCKTASVCPYYDQTEEETHDYRCVERLMEQAADAIEELQEDNSDLHGTISNLLEQFPELGKLKWISVTERLPKEWWPVLGLIQYHDEKEPPAQQVLWYLGNGHWRETWRGDMIESDVTHWMPLPEPPKEGE